MCYPSFKFLELGQWRINLWILQTMLNFLICSQSVTIHLSPSSKEASFYISEENIFKLICSNGSEWIIPPSVPSESVKIIQEYPGSYLQFTPSCVGELATVRGLYECCSPEYSPTIHRHTRFEPSCCPCCPWYDQPRCQSTKNCRESVFILTPYIPTERTAITVITKDQLLIPCPGESNQMESIPTIQFGFENYPIMSSNRNGTIYGGHFDPRIGVCIQNASMKIDNLPVVHCHYPKLNKTRMIDVRWASPTPSKPPKTRLILSDYSSNPDQLQNILTGHIDGSGSSGVYRIWPNNPVEFHCFAWFDHYIVVNINPPVLMCFRWRLVDDIAGKSAPNKEAEPSTTDRFQSEHGLITNFECTEIKRFSTPNSTWIYAVAYFNIHSQSHQNATVTCEAQTQQLHAPIGRTTVELKLQSAAENDKLTWWINHPILNFELLTREQVPPSISYNRTSASGNVLDIRFHSLNEITHWPHCLLLIDAKNSPSRSLRIDRIGESWSCSLDLNILHHSVSILRIEFGLGNLTDNLNVHRLKTPVVNGMHGYIFERLNLTCQFDNNQSDWIVQPRYQWSIHTDKDTIQRLVTPTNHLKLDALFDQMNYSHFTHSTSIFPSKAFIKHIRVEWAEFPKQLCVQCELQFQGFVNITSHLNCTRLVDTQLQPRPYQEEINYESNISLYMEQVEMVKTPDFIWNGPENRTELAMPILHGIPVTIGCLNQIVPGDQEEGLPDLVVSSENNLKDFVQSWTLKPYSLHTKRKFLSSVTKNKSFTHFTCRYNGKETTSRLFWLEPVGVRIIDPANNSFLNGDTENTNSMLKCDAIGVPNPQIQIEFCEQITGGNTNCWHVPQTCLKPDVLDWVNHRVTCSTPIDPEQLIRRDVFARCTAWNVLNYTQSYIFFKNNNATTNWLGDRSKEVIVKFICITLISLLLLVFTAGACYYKFTKKLIANMGLKRTYNILYRRPFKLNVPEQPISLNDQTDWENLKLASELIGCIDEVMKWILPHDTVKTSSQKVGSGHYGKVCRGWLDTQYIGSNNDKPHLKFISNCNEKQISVAIKTTCEEPSSLNCLLNEIRLLMKMDDAPNIVSMIGFTLCSVTTQAILTRDIWLVLEYCENKSLNEYLNKNRSRFLTSLEKHQKISLRSSDSGISSPIEEELLKCDDEPIRAREDKNYTMSKFETVYHLYRIAFGIGHGLDYLSRVGIIHRDLALRNILLNQNIEPKICDFGLAVQVNPQNDDNSYSNSPYASAYKIMTHQKRLPFRILPIEALEEQLFYTASDIWQYGLLLWQLFRVDTRPPFTNVTSADELLTVLMGKKRVEGKLTCSDLLEKPTVLDDHLWDLMCHAWSFDHRQRPTTRRFMRHLSEVLLSLRDSERCVVKTNWDNLVTYTELVHTL